MNFPKNFLYTKDHEWAEQIDGTVRIGITDHAQNSLGDIVFVELPKVGRELKVHETFGVVESIKAVSDLYSPISGTVVAINESATQDPSLINRASQSEGWLIQVKPANKADLDSLMKADDYKKLVEAL